MNSVTIESGLTVAANVALALAPDEESVTVTTTLGAPVAA
jgi:hypothetical protein